jgi:inositol-phosphate phosphatase/L-galactose 1-phosphate phosphatase/histidinol-phosphatase
MNKFEIAEYCDFVKKLFGVAIPILENNYSELVLAASNNINDAILWKNDSLKSEIVTKGEQLAEAAMRAIVNDRYPSHGIAGEELGYEINDSGFLWAFDPIDGTAAMVQSAINQAKSITCADNCKPYFGITIALLHNNQPIIGAVYDFQNHNFWLGCLGSPTILNGEIIKIADCKQLNDAIIASTAPEIMFSSTVQQNKFASIRAKARSIYTNRNCIGFMQLLTGEIDAVWEGDLALHDIAAIIPILQNAGLHVTDEAGEEIKFEHQNYDNEYRVIASQAKLHAEILENIDENYVGFFSQPNNDFYNKKF